MSEPGIRIFLDRSIGTKKIAAALKSLSLEVETIQDRYGYEASRIVDVRWIEEATADGCILISADQRTGTTRLNGGQSVGTLPVASRSPERSDGGRNDKSPAKPH